MEHWENCLQMSKFCELCYREVDHKLAHLEIFHGWVRCTICRNLMSQRFMDEHLERDHNQKQPPREGFQAQKRKNDCDDANEEQNENYGFDETNTQPHQRSKTTTE